MSEEVEGSDDAAVVATGLVYRSSLTPKAPVGWIVDVEESESGAPPPS